MKIWAITLNNFNGLNRIQMRKNPSDSTVTPNYHGNIHDLSCMPVYQIPFTSVQNSSKLRTLFRYNLPCIYSGIPMIDPKQLNKMIKSGIFKAQSKESVAALTKFKDCYSGFEQKIVNILINRSKIHPDYTIKQLILEIEPFYRRDLRRKQSGIFHNIALGIEKLPQQYQDQFAVLMKETNKRLDEKPVIKPFSSYEFKYKLAKINTDIANENDIKAKKVMKKLIKESKKFANSTNPSTLNNQKQVIGMLDWILKKSVLKNNEELKELISNSQARLTQQKIVIPFSRKSFIYDLHKIIDDIPDKELKNSILHEAYKLPTSSQEFSAYAVKLSGDTSEKIATRILWPYLASVEHLVPRSVGGPDIMANFAGATTRENSLRKSIDFTEQMKLRPNTPIYCQKYVDKLTELYKNGIFTRNQINPKYIEDFKNTIYQVSKGQIDLDLSEYYALKGKV